MGENTKIQWAHHTFNPWIGCAKVSPACAHCYAENETFPRVQRANGRELWGPKAERHVTSAAHWREPVRWNTEAAAAGERRRVFCASLADVFENRPDLALQRARLCMLIEETPWLDWLLLTKRPQNMRRLAPWKGDWPRNVWAGVTAEDQPRYDQRVPELLGVPAAAWFVSIEPILERIDLRARTAEQRELCIRCGEPRSAPHDHIDGYRTRGIDWVIIGGESGPEARPTMVDDLRDVVSQARGAGAAVFVKQLGSRAIVMPYKGSGRKYRPSEIVEGSRGYEELRKILGASRELVLKHPKGGDPDEWPEDLRVREMPKVAR